MPVPRPHRRARTIAVAVLSALVTTVLLAACGTPGDVPDENGGTISGVLRVASPSSVPSTSGGPTLPSAVPASGPAAWSLDALGTYGADVVPGEVIVAFEPGRPAAASIRLDAPGVTVTAVRPLAIPGAHLYRAPGTDPRALARQLARRPGVRYAQPNYLLQPQQTREPDDAIWLSDRSALWHYDALDLPEAWAITTGSASTVVAVLDTGILVDPSDPSASASHPDLVGKTLPGYDFISDPTIAGDGDGRDANPYDVGDEPSGQPSYHGTHVAGTIGASADDAYGIPGVAWQARILPIRVLGIGGGTMVDIVEGALWAAGFPIDGVPVNPTPADVLNLSLGGAAACSPYEQDAFDRIATSSPSGAVVVVAAGNDGVDAAGFTPAGCRNVVTVGASDTRDYRAPYSNYGTRIDVMAPGGDTSVDRNGDGYVDGVLSTWGVAPSGGAPTMDWGFLQGTSMAAPHVAGVVALMKALDPDLTFVEVEGLLAATAQPWTATQCQRALASDCGAGRVDVPAVLRAVQGGVAPPPVGEPLTFSPEPLDFGSDLVTAAVTITNTSTRQIAWSLVYTEDPSNPAPLYEGWIAGASSGTVPAGGSVELTFEVDRDFVGADGAFDATLDFLENWDGASADSVSSLSIRIVKSSTSTAPTGPTGVYAYLPDVTEPSGWRESGSVQASSPFSSFEVAVEAGDTLLVGWIDENANDLVDDGDLLGTYPSLIPVADGSDIRGIAIDLAPYAGLPASSEPPPSLDAWLATEAGSILLERLLEGR